MVCRRYDIHRRKRIDGCNASMCLVDIRASNEYQSHSDSWHTDSLRTYVDCYHHIRYKDHHNIHFYCMMNSFYILEIETIKKFDISVVHIGKQITII